MFHLSQLGPIVTIYNRCVDESGQPLPYTAYADGIPMTFLESIQVPAGVARILVHQSMYRIDPVTNAGEYKLAVRDWNMDTSPLKPDMIGEELVDRRLLPPHRQNIKRAPLHNPIKRQDPLGVSIPGPRDNGAHPGGFGEAFAR